MPRVMNLFEEKAKGYIKISLNTKILNTIVGENSFILYYSGKTIKPNNLLEFIDETAEVIHVFTQE